MLTISLVPLHAAAVGKGASYNGNETIKNERLTSYEDLVKQLERADNRSDNVNVEVIGQSVKGRNLHLVKFGNNPENPTILFLTQQHGNEALITEAALHVIKNLSGNSRQVQELADEVNVFFVPRLNPDGAEGDVNFDTSDHVLGGLATVNNANNVNLNRDHIDRLEPETAALHNNVLQRYNIDYLVDFHHQSAQYAVDDRYVSGAMLYPTNSEVDEDVIEMSKQLGAVMYDAVDARGFGNIAKYVGGDALTISRNGLAYEYGRESTRIKIRKI